MKRLFLTALLLWSVSPLLAQTIYPTPHKIERGTGVFLGKDASVVTFKEDKSLPSEAYILEVTARLITITSSSDRGAFYGCVTLEQIAAQGAVPVMTITDSPDIPFRGTVEGFYGKPWSHRDRLAQLQFYGLNKLNTYIYGPKDDPYHSSPNWRLPYPEQQGAQIAELASVAKKNHVDFVWAIHPGLDIKWTEADFQILLAKFNSMYGLGVRSFALFFDDISGEGTNPHKQAELLNRLNKEFVQAKGDVTPLIMCPTEYNKSWANPTSNGYLSILGRELDKSVQIMWTGDKVCDNITTETLTWIADRIGRSSYIWWNFPVTDYARHLVVQGPSYGLTKEGRGLMNGFVSNPMENAEASKVALMGVADYCWNIEAYDYLKTWELALRTLMPHAAQAYRTFAMHSADFEQNGHGFRRDESWEIAPLMKAHLDGTADNSTIIAQEYAKMEAAPEQIFASKDNAALIAELRPWLVQFAKLGQRGQQVLALEKSFKQDSSDVFWSNYLAGTMSDEAIKAYNAHKSGTYIMQPFIDKTRARLGEEFYEQLTGQKITKPTPITNFERTETLYEMMDGRTDTYYYSWGLQSVGSWVGVDLGQVQSVTNIIIDQGRKDGDNDYFQSALLEISKDNKLWTPLSDTLHQIYNIRYNARPVEARYVRLRATEGASPKNWTAIRRFDVNPLQNKPVIMTNIPQIAPLKVVTEGKYVSVKPMLEIVKVAPGGYLGIELPVICDLGSVSVELNIGSVALEYSLDGIMWSVQKPAKARYIRYINKSNREVPIVLKSMVVELHGDDNADLLAAMDGDLLTGYTPTQESVVVNVPPHTLGVSVLCDGGEWILLNDKGGQIGSSKNGFMNSPVASAVKSITIKGKGQIREIIWKR
ncbi:MAG: beta-N-acetylglucosaminidase domain-containing protein [Mucinivorans sp.]